MSARTDADSKFAAEAAVFLNIMDEMAPQIGLDYSVDSIQRLENFIAEHFDPPGSRQVSDSLVVGIGCYLGEVIIRHLGGHWNHDGRPEINRIGGAVEAVYPIDKARKRFENGPGDSLAWAYHSIVRHAHEAGQRGENRNGGLMGKLFGLFRK